MPEEKKVLLEIDIDADALAAQVMEATKRVQELTDKLKVLKFTGETNTAEFHKTTAELKNWRKEVNDGTTTLAKLDQLQKVNTGSIEEMRINLGILTKQYNTLSKEERENIEIGGRLKDQTEKLSTELKGLEKGVGNTTRNVGNYKDSVKEALMEMLPFGNQIGQAARGFNSMSSAVSGTSKVMNVLKVAIAGTGIGLLLIAFASLISYLKAFDPVVDAFERGMAGVNTVFKMIGSSVASFSNLFTDFKGSMQSVAGFMASPIQSLKNYGKALGDAANETMRLTEAQQDLEDKMSVQETKTLASQNRIAELMLKARNRALSQEDRNKYLAEARALEEKDYSERSKLAEQNFNISLNQAKNFSKTKSELTKEEMRELGRGNVQLAMNLLNAGRIEQTHYDKIKETWEARLNLQAESTQTLDRMQNLSDARQMMADSKAATAASKRQQEEEKRLQKEAEHRALVEKGAMEDAEFAFQQGLKNMSARDQEMFTLQRDYDLKIALRKKDNIDTAALEEEARIKSLEIKQKYDAFDYEDRLRMQERDDADNQAIIDRRIAGDIALKESTEQLAMAKAIAYQEGLELMRDIFGQESLIGKAAFLAQKALALAQIKINLAKEISGINASPTTNALGIFGLPIKTSQILIAKIYAAINASSIIGTAIQGFATGGYFSDGKGSYLKGAGTGTSDSINARLSNGESVINARSTAMFGGLLSHINQLGGGKAFNVPAGTNLATGGIFSGQMGAIMDNSLSAQKLVNETAMAVARYMPRQILVVEEVQSALGDKAYISERGNI